MYMPKQLFCTRCHKTGHPTSKAPGSFVGELAVWVIFIVISSISTFLLLVIPLIYTLFRQFNQTKVCDACGSTELIPLDSPKAIEILGEPKEQMVQPTVKASDIDII